MKKIRRILCVCLIPGILASCCKEEIMLPDEGTFETTLGPGIAADAEILPSGDIVIVGGFNGEAYFSQTDSKGAQQDGFPKFYSFEDSRKDNFFYDVEIGRGAEMEGKLLIAGQAFRQSTGNIGGLYVMTDRLGNIESEKIRSSYSSEYIAYGVCQLADFKPLAAMDNKRDAKPDRASIWQVNGQTATCPYVYTDNNSAAFDIASVGECFIFTGYTEESGTGKKKNVYINAGAEGFGGDGDDIGYDVEATEDGGFLVVGYTESFGEGGKDVYLLRFDAQKSAMWQKTYGGPGDDIGYNVEELSDGSIAIVGFTTSSSRGAEDIYYLHVSENGQVLSEKQFGTGGKDIGYDVEETTDNGVIIVGEKEGEVYLAKTNFDGEF